jgi:bifunctional NMN adenylyltransferase/nudix hydrolase
MIFLDSFIPYYKNNGGVFDCEELVQYTFVSGTEVRKKASDEVKDSEDFRAGMIYQAYNQYPKVHPFVNVAIIDNDKVLLARSPYDNKWKFIGGFVKPSDNSYELATKRIISEDVGINLEIGTFNYIGSTRIVDWRYKGEEDEVITTFYKTKRGWGNIEPSDDISELKFWDIKDITETIMVDEHQPLLSMFINDMKFKN